MAQYIVDTMGYENTHFATMGKTTWLVQNKYRQILAGTNGDVLNRSMSNELGHLAQELSSIRPVAKSIKGMDTVFFTPRNKVPAWEKVTYANCICNIWHLNEEKHRIHMTVSGDQLHYEDDYISPAVSLLDANIIFNSVISDAWSVYRYCTVNIKSFYLNNPTSTYHYMKIPLK